MKKLIIILILVLLSISLAAKSKWTGEDKVLHYTGSAFLTYWNYGVCKDILDQSSGNSTYFAVTFSLALGTAKEVTDNKFKNTGFSWQDLVYDTAGIITGIILINNLR
ncbi:MAG: hypothetical protein K9N07_03840 [Candidatus Cloacimonetes bacterium]|nr:hypothetical protein [Candidatus Cloacimonadota bacterium]